MVASKSRMFRTPSGKLVTTSDAQKAGVSTDVAKLTEDDIKKLAKAASDRLGMAVNTNTLRQDGGQIAGITETPQKTKEVIAIKAGSRGSINWLDASEDDISGMRSSINARNKLIKQSRSVYKKGKMSKSMYEEDMARYGSFTAQEKRLAQTMPQKPLSGTQQKNLETAFKNKTFQSASYAKIQYKAAMTPLETIARYDGTAQLRKDFAKHAELSGGFWKDKRTGRSFVVGNAIKRDLSEQLAAREILGLPPDKTPSGS